MMELIAEYGGTALIGALLAGAVALIVTRMVRGLKQGKQPGCGCGCSECHKDPTKT